MADKTKMQGITKRTLDRLVTASALAGLVFRQQGLNTWLERRGSDQSRICDVTNSG